MTIFLKKVVNHVFGAFFHDSISDLRATFKYKLLIVSLMGILAATAVATLVYYN